MDVWFKLANMPPVEIKSSWADEVEEVTSGVIDEGPTETFENGIKTVTEIKTNEDDKRIKVIRTYKVEKRLVSKTVAMRKTYKKFGNSANDPPGPNPATTIVSEDVFMQFITSKEDQDKPGEDAFDKLKSMEKSTFVCRTCNGPHWTLRCPYKETGYKMEEKKPVAPVPVPQTDEKGKPKYVAPGLREGSTKKGEMMSSGRVRDEVAIRISNLPDTTQEADLDELVKKFGPYHKLFLAKDKATGLCKGFAYIHFKYRQDACRAIATLHRHGYDHLILNVEWSKPQAQT